MDYQDTIWILVPVYNVEKVLDKCIRSIQQQTYTNWKLVLVDDGSTDRSGRMCDEYAKKDSRICVLHTQNGGPHAARTKGVALLPEDGYCVFCDSDDELPKDALKLMHKEAVRSGADIVCGNVQRIFKGFVVDKGHSHSCFNQPRVYKQNEILSHLYLCCFGGGGTSRFMPTFLDDNILMYRLKMQWSDKCTSTENVKRLIGVELKNIIVSYWIMCEKNRRYPQGSLLEEVKAVCAIPEVQEALTMLEGDRSGLPGINQPLLERDYDAVCDLICRKVKKDRPKDILKKILMG